MMDAAELLGLARALVEAPSPSGEEGPALLVAERALRAAGLRVLRQEIGSADRFNLFASSGQPRVVLTTHLDTVPGTIPVHVEDGRLFGRGACDAKGAAAAMIGTARGLRESDLTDFGILFLVGAETASDGAVAAEALLASRAMGWRCEHALFGEPTGNCWATAHPGIVQATLRTRGRRGRSLVVSETVSAIHDLVDWLHVLRHERWPADAELGATLFQVHRIAGGGATNVADEEAVADVLFRSGARPAELESRLRKTAPDEAEVDVTGVAAPVRFATGAPDGLSAGVAGPVLFATDAPYLPSLGKPYLCGPGTLEGDQWDDEHVRVDELHAGLRRYTAWATALLRPMA